MKHQSTSSAPPGPSGHGASPSACSSQTDKNLQLNPFTTYRDPDTGRWMVVQSFLSASSFGRNW